MTASAPAVLICSARVSESYPLSAMTASVEDALSNAIAWVQSASCPAVIVNDNGRPSSPADKWILIVRPPYAPQKPCLPPFFAARSRLPMGAHHGRIDHQVLVLPVLHQFVEYPFPRP
jgi:hypothetical protein